MPEILHGKEPKQGGVLIALSPQKLLVLAFAYIIQKRKTSREREREKIKRERESEGERETERERERENKHLNPKARDPGPTEIRTPMALNTESLGGFGMLVSLEPRKLLEPAVTF